MIILKFQDFAAMNPSKTTQIRFPLPYLRFWGSAAPEKLLGRKAEYPWETDICAPAAARRCGISDATAKTHLTNIFEKTGTHRQAELVRCLLGAAEAQGGKT